MKKLVVIILKVYRVLKEMDIEDNKTQLDPVILVKSGIYNSHNLTVSSHKTILMMILMETFAEIQTMLVRTFGAILPIFGRDGNIVILFMKKSEDQVKNP